MTYIYAQCKLCQFECNMGKYSGPMNMVSSKDNTDVGWIRAKGRTHTGCGQEVLGAYYKES